MFLVPADKLILNTPPPPSLQYPCIPLISRLAITHISVICWLKHSYIVVAAVNSFFFAVSTPASNYKNSNQPHTVWVPY